jgi:hypothetical protein
MLKIPVQMQALFWLCATKEFFNCQQTGMLVSGALIPAKGQR